MKRPGLLLLAVLMVIGLAGCSSNSSTEPETSPWAFENVKYQRDGNYTDVSGIARNVSKYSSVCLGVGVKATFADNTFEQRFDPIYLEVPAGQGVNFSCFVKTYGKVVTKWELWVTER